MGGFATSLITVCLAMMNFRDVTVQTINIGNLCFVASVGLLISAQWEMVRGNTFSYTVLSAYGTSPAHLVPDRGTIADDMSFEGLFYGGYGVLLLPTLNIAGAYGGASTPEYNNAFGFYVLSEYKGDEEDVIHSVTDCAPVWGVFNTFFLITSTA